ncbi:MAG TPA: hypothetical protein VMV33_06215 [Rhodocyclaceae bacterium]|nr:hypothetical protein [Rhodocyclaceae bacterium]
MRVVALVPLFALLLAQAPARADEQVTVCYNYGCASRQTVNFTARQLDQLHQMLAAASTAAAERSALARAVGRLYAWAGEQSPIWRDRGGNYADGGVDGKMDCIDHSTTTTRFLRLLERCGWLRFHRVLPPVRRVRFLISVHWSALIEELPSPGAGPAAAPRRFVVDSWFVDNGRPAVVLPLQQWLNGGGPNV